MSFKVKKPFDVYFKDLEKRNKVEIKDKIAGLYALRLEKCQKINAINIERKGLNWWEISKKRDIKKKTENKKYTIFY